MTLLIVLIVLVSGVSLSFTLLIGFFSGPHAVKLLFFHLVILIVIIDNANFVTLLNIQFVTKLLTLLQYFKFYRIGP